MKSRVRSSLVTLGILAVLAAAGWVLVLRPMKLRGDQVMNCSELAVHGEAVQRFFKSHGEYPATLEEAIRASGFPTRSGGGRDVWGNKLIYRNDGHIFMIVSLGRSGRPDGTDFWHIAGTPVTDRQAEARRCANPDAWAMISGDDRSRACCK